MSVVKSWQGMRQRCEDLLMAATGAGVDGWNERVAAASPGSEQELRDWLGARGVTGYAQALLVWERFGYPEFLTADAQELIDAQYADRTALRPVLDAVLAAAMELGDVTVQARKTIVSLVSPRRTFAVVQARTLSRVDLGLRLDGQEPGGRLLAARDLGAANVRIPLTTAADLDADAITLLRRAYDESVAPPKPRRPPAPRPKNKTPVTVVIDGYDLPGIGCRPGPAGTPYRAVHVGREKRGETGLPMPGGQRRVIELFRGDAGSARWEVTISVSRGPDGFDFFGPDVRGDKTDRHLGLVWGEVTGDGTFRLFRGAKLRLVDIAPEVIEEALRTDRVLTARVRLTDRNGNPICARVRPPDIAWSATHSAKP